MLNALRAPESLPSYIIHMHYNQSVLNLTISRTFFQQNLPQCFYIDSILENLCLNKISWFFFLFVCLLLLLVDNLKYRLKIGAWKYLLSCHWLKYEIFLLPLLKAFSCEELLFTKMLRVEATEQGPLEISVPQFLSWITVIKTKSPGNDCSLTHNHIHVD